MRVLLILFALLVFGAMLLFDTAGLIRLTLYCVGGGCGIRPLWIGLGSAAVALVFLVIAHRQTRGAARPAKPAPRKPVSTKPGKPDDKPSARKGASTPRKGRAAAGGKAPTGKAGTKARSRRPKT
ncbi:MAG: hypothetical protein AB7O80_23020 [Acetobacteraceae bacterium]